MAQYSGTGPPKFLTQTAEQVAQEILDASRRNRSGVFITGRMNRAMLSLARATFSPCFKAYAKKFRARSDIRIDNQAINVKKEKT